MHRCVFPFLLTIIIPRISLLQLVKSHHDSWSMNFNLLSCHQHVGIWNNWSHYFFDLLCFGWISFCWDCVVAYFIFLTINVFSCSHFLITEIILTPETLNWILLCTWRMGDTGSLVKSSNYRLEIVGGLIYIYIYMSSWQRMIIASSEHGSTEVSYYSPIFFFFFFFWGIFFISYYLSELVLLCLSLYIQLS